MVAPHPGAAAEGEARDLGAILVDGQMSDPLLRARATVALADLHAGTEGLMP